jgi:cystathionine beta-synthase
MYYNSIIDTIGNTPLVKLNKVTRNLKGTILAKLEYFNPGNSMKDRMAVKMIADAEKSGQLRPGGTIIEGTSGNTGMGLALAAIARGYKCIFTLADKQSREKIDILRAMGAEVIVCPTNVPPDDPKSYYSVAKKLSREIPNSFYVNQYDNLSNTAAHYESTGPEIWKDTEGKITHFAAGVGTGGSMSGIGRFLKEKNSRIKTIGIDSYGSVFKKYKETGIFDEKEVYPYLTEGIGEDILPKNVDFEIVDHFIKVTDKDAAIMARRLAREEGLFIGWSCGSAVHGALEYARNNLSEADMMVILMPDHGTRYLNKIYNDNWMKDHGYLEEREFATARDILRKQGNNQRLVTIEADMTIEEAILVMSQEGISQVPVIRGEQIVGTVTDSRILKNLIENPGISKEKVREIMDDPLPFVAMDNTVDVLSSLIDKKVSAVLVRDENNETHIITQHDILLAMTS